MEEHESVQGSMYVLGNKWRQDPEEVKHCQMEEDFFIL